MSRISMILLVMFVVLFYFQKVDGFASYLACDIALEDGVVIMGSAVETNRKRTLKVFQNEKEINNGSVLSSLENIIVKLEPKSSQMILDAEGASFIGGSCSGKRSMKNAVELYIMPEILNGGVVKLVGAWARTYEEGVKLTEPFTLHFSATPNADEVKSTEL